MVLLRFIPVAGISLFFLFIDSAPLYRYIIIYLFTSSWKTFVFFPFCGCFKECWNIQLSCGFVLFFPSVLSIFALCILKFCYYVHTRFRLCSWWINSFFYNFIYFWLRWVLVATCGLPLVVASGGYSSLWCAGFSSQWLLLLRSTGSRCAGFSSCGTQTQ